jgi:hypothetical protein
MASAARDVTGPPPPAAVRPSAMKKDPSYEAAAPPSSSPPPQHGGGGGWRGRSNSNSSSCDDIGRSFSDVVIDPIPGQGRKSNPEVSEEVLSGKLAFATLGRQCSKKNISEKVNVVDIFEGLPPHPPCWGKN